MQSSRSSSSKTKRKPSNRGKSTSLYEQDTKEVVAKICRQSNVYQRKAPEQKNKRLKVCNVLRSRQVGVVASSLDELRSKIQKHFPVSDRFDVVLEEDCTAIEDKEYFQTLPDDTVVMAINKGETWKEAPTLDSEHGSGFVEVDGQTSHDRLVQVTDRIARKPALVAFLPKADLEVLVDADINMLQALLRQSKDDAKFIQDACERQLNRLIRTDEALDLLKLYHRAKSHSEESTKGSEMDKGQVTRGTKRAKKKSF